MADKINGLRPSDTAGARRADAAASARKEAKAAGSHRAASAAADTVNITRSGLLMSKLEEIVHGAPAVDFKRVAAIKDALASGSYEIDDQRIADRLLGFERNLVR